MTNWKQSLALIALALVFASLVFGQSATGTISGTVSDASGAAVANAKVTAKNTGTAAETTATTNETGLYRFVELPTGNYTITVEVPGFRKTTLSPQRLIVASSLRMDVTLEVGEVTTAVTVESTAPQVMTDDAQLGKTMTQIDDLPLLSGNAGRNALNLVTLQPGVSVPPASNAPGTSVGPFSVNGQRTQANNFILDGADANDLAINVPDGVDVISPNALGEFRVVTGAMKAEYGRNSGAVVEGTIKSGTNQFHGELTEIFRNKDLNANNFFLNQSGTPRPPFNLNDFDANIGGPVFKNKTFFFASYLGFRRVLGQSNSGTVFTDAERQAILAGGTDAAKAVVGITPAANSGGDQFVSAPTDRLNRDQGVLRIDHHFSDRNNLSVSYFTERFTDSAPFAFIGPALPGFGELDFTTYHNVAIHDTHAFSPTLVNEATAAFHRRDQPGVQPENHTTPASLGFTGIIPDDPAAAGPPNFNIDAINVGNTYQGPQARFDNNWQYRDTVSWIKGRHSFKFGAEYRAYEQNQIFDFINNGYLQFTGDFTLGSFGSPTPVLPGLENSSPSVNDFAHGQVLFYDQSNANKQGYRDKFFSAFAQDDFKATRNLTINFGLRYDYGEPLTELHNRVSTFRPGQQSTVFPSAPPGLVFPGDAGISASTYSPDKLNFGPRVGIAWDPTGTGKLSVRSGFGLFYNVPESELTLQYLGAAPYGAQVIAIASTDMTNPYQTSLVNPKTTNPFPFVSAKPGDNFDFTSVAPVGVTMMDPHFQTPSAMQYDLQIQYQVAKDWLIDVAYVGTQGRHLEDRRNVNPALILAGANTGNDDARRLYNQGNPLNDQYGGAVFGGITDQLSDSNSSYNSLQIFLEKRFSHGFSVTNSYTYAHCIDNGSGLRTNSNPYSASYDRGNCDQDIRHSFIGTAFYELPWFRDQRGFAGHLLGGFNIATVISLQSGIPFDITDSGDRSLTGAGDDRPDYIGGDVHFVDPRNNDFGRANSFFDGTGAGTASASTNPYFNRVGTGGSLAQGAGRYGNLGRNVFHGPGTLNTDLRIAKRTHITERQSLEFRAEAFNFFNHTQFFNPSGAITSSSFGRITTAHDPRLLQLSLQYRF